MKKFILIFVVILLQTHWAHAIKPGPEVSCCYIVKRDGKVPDYCAKSLSHIEERNTNCDQVIKSWKEFEKRWVEKRSINNL